MTGRGIGLPYTGPMGEPIFGLTPAQRLAQAGIGFDSDSNQSLARALEPDPKRPTTTAAQKKKRLMLYGGILGVAIVVGIAIAVLTIPKRSSDGGHDEERPDPKTVAGQAYDALQRTEIDAALKLLTDDKDQIKAALANDPHAQLVLGHVYATRNDTKHALEAYLKAMQLDPELKTRKRMRSALRAMAALEKNATLAADAMQVWFVTDDSEARSALVNAAVSEDMARRKAVRPVIARYKLHDEVNWIASYNYDLQQEPECDDRKEVVARLRALGDPRAIPALQQAIARKGTQGKYANKPINGCLVDDAKAAIGYLQGLKKATPKAP
jgi:tetratricopeptide (TPR) repeat protein